MARFTCEECNWNGPEEEVLRAPNPFAYKETMIGCPICREPNVLKLACDEPGCVEFVICGTNTPTGYRQTCNEHRPRG